MYQKLKWAEAEKILNANKPGELIFITFTAEWCGDCQMMKRPLNYVADKFKDRPEIKFINVDAEEAQLFRNPDTKWAVLKVPTMILLSGQEIIEKGYEYIPEEIMIDWIDKRIN
ncbi:thioredoxin family protein [Mycoplasma leonicaptivi]|uniref:thioredoxin family protein n=1 Tax=Mycoplasma leonicaptivi TaxID=36742 RepID=UPI000484CEEC|nr:thioredoxin family protein [Mycoplasma leonicaptivi]